MKGKPFFYFAYGACCAEVAIDTLTGEMRVLGADILHDVGSSLNPAIDLGQVEGAFIQGMGWVTTEELVWDGKGRLATHAPATYKIPVASDTPERFRTRLHMRPNATESIYRSKAVGEPPFMLGIAVYCAILDAVHACAPAGHPDLASPATPEAILKRDRLARLKRRVPDGAQGRNRTTDTAIFSRMLYQLSYLGRRAGARRGAGL